MLHGFVKYVYFISLDYRITYLVANLVFELKHRQGG